MHLHLPLADFATERAALGHTQHSQQTRLERPIRGSIGESLSLTRPILSKSIVAETSADIFGAFTPAGSVPASSASFSATSWRAGRISVPSLNITVTTESP
jgi:hypothetical protein